MQNSGGAVAGLALFSERDDLVTRAGAEDLPALRRMRNRVLDFIQLRRPQWFRADEAAQSNKPSASSGPHIEETV